MFMSEDLPLLRKRYVTCFLSFETYTIPFQNFQASNSYLDQETYIISRLFSGARDLSSLH